MTPFNPTLGAKDTALNVKNFMATNKDTFWNVLKPLLPWIIGLNLLDVVITALFFADSENGFGLGGIAAAYFSTALVITWHRVVIHGPDNYTAMNPFKPQKHELVFLGMGILIGVLCTVIGAIAGGLGIAIGGIPMAIILVLSLTIIALYLSYKICFYFPAKAINHGITFGQSYELTKGYFWKLMGASFLAMLKYVLLTIAYFIGVIILIGGLSVLFKESDFIVQILGFAIVLPLIAFLQPMLAVIGVTVLSNYFQHALQNKL